MIRETIMTLLQSLGINPGNSPMVLIVIAIAQLYSTDSCSILKNCNIPLPFSMSDPSVDITIRRIGSFIRNWPFEKIYSEIIEPNALYPYRLKSGLTVEQKYKYAYSYMLAMQHILKKSKDTQTILEDKGVHFADVHTSIFPSDDPVDEKTETLIAENLGIRYIINPSTTSTNEIQRILSARKAWAIPYDILQEIYSIWRCNRSLFLNTDNSWNTACEHFPDLASRYQDIHVPDLFNLINDNLNDTDPVTFLSVLFSSQSRHSDLEAFYLFQLIYKLSYPRNKTRILLINPPLSIISSLNASNIRDACLIIIPSKSLLDLYRLRFSELTFISSAEIRNNSFNKIICFCRNDHFAQSFQSLNSICQKRRGVSDPVETVHLVTTDADFTKSKTILTEQVSEMYLTHVLRLPAAKYKTNSGKEHQSDTKLLLRFECSSISRDHPVQISELIDIGNGTALFAPFTPCIPCHEILSSGKTLKGIYGDGKKELLNNSKQKDKSNQKKGIYVFSNDVLFRYTIDKDTNNNGYIGVVFFEMDNKTDDLRFDIHRLTEEEIFKEIELIPFSDRKRKPRLLSFLKQRIMDHSIQNPCLKTIWCILHDDLMRDIDGIYNYYLCNDIFSPDHIDMSSLQIQYSRNDCEAAILADYNEKWDTIDICILRQLKFLLNRASEEGFDANTLTIAEMIKARNRKGARKSNTLKQLRKKVLFSEEQLNIVIPSYKNVFCADVNVDYNSFFADAYSILRVFLPLDPDEWAALDMGDYSLINQTRFMGLNIYKSIGENDQIIMFSDSGKKQKLRLIPPGDKLEEIIKLYFAGLKQIDPHACDNDRPFLQVMSGSTLRRLSLKEIKALDDTIDKRSGRRNYHQIVELADGTIVDLGNKKGSILKSNFKYKVKKIGFTEAERYYGLGQKAKKPLDVNYTDSANPYLLMDYAKKTDRWVCDTLNQQQPTECNSRQTTIIRIPPDCQCSIDLSGLEFGINCTAYFIQTNADNIGKDET